MNQKHKAEQLAALHMKGDPLILYNIWDAGSARALEAAGAKAIATGSWSVAAAQGYQDGEAIPFSLIEGIHARIVTATELPVTVDFESGYAHEAHAVAENVARLLDIGVAGINFEDQRIGANGLYSIDEQSARLRAIRQRADAADVPLFLNARTDLFLQNDAAQHATFLEEAKELAMAYHEAGASGLFVPGLVDSDLVADLCASAPLPINIMMMNGAPDVKHLAAAGVSRISYGPLPFITLMRALQEQAREALNG